MLRNEIKFTNRLVTPLQFISKFLKKFLLEKNGFSFGQKIPIKLTWTIGITANFINIIMYRLLRVRNRLETPPNFFAEPLNKTDKIKKLKKKITKIVKKLMLRIMKVEFETPFSITFI